MTKSDSATIHLGSKNDGGYKLTIVRGFDDGTTEYTKKFVEYICHGVSDVDIQDQYNIGGGDISIIKVEFVTGSVERIDGVIADIEVDND